MSLDLSHLPLATLIRRRDQHWEMAGLARKDGDLKDAEVHNVQARMYTQEISKRKDQS
jgi:hypothetical protein